MVDDIRDVVIVGGGISGLTAGWYLHHAGMDVCLLDAQTEVGGVTQTQRRDGFLLEKGPFNVIVRDPAFMTLLEGLSSEVKIISASPAAKKRFVYKRGRLLAVPNNPIALATTPLLSMSAKLRLVRGMIIGRRSDGSEETIEQVAVRRFGREVTDTMISAVVAGIFAGDIKKLSAPACFPSVAKVDREARSLLAYGLKAGVRAKRSEKKKQRDGDGPARPWRGLVSVDGGLGALTAALGAPLGPNRVTGCRADAIRGADFGYEIVCETLDDGPRTFRTRHLVLASSVHEASRLLEPIMPEAADILAPIVSAPMVVVNLGFKREDVEHPLDGFGFLVPQSEPDFPLLGVLWADSIFPHHAPPGRCLLRVFVGGSRTPDAATLSDDELVSRAMSGMGDLLQVRGDPVLVDTCRWPAAIPQYHVGHLERIARLHAEIERLGNLDLVGNYLEGVSLNDCVRCATNVADKIIGELMAEDRSCSPALAASS